MALLFMVGKFVIFHEKKNIMESEKNAEEKNSLEGYEKNSHRHIHILNNGKQIYISICIIKKKTKQSVNTFQRVIKKMKDSYRK